jgi:putative multicomponent Na+:H+ antiporter subunit B
MIENYTYAIVALLPLSALMLVTQVNPYRALVIRAILGAIAALIYAILGAGDVALTEAMVGTMLAMTLYVIAVRSSLVMRLGVLTEDTKINLVKEKDNYLEELIAKVKKIVNKHHLRFELIKYPNLKALQQSLAAQEIHAICTTQKPLETLDRNNHQAIETKQIYHTTIRVHRLFEIMQSELTFPETTLNYVTTTDLEEQI